MMKLADLKPQLVELQLFDHEGNEKAVITVMPLSFSQWNEAELDLSPPERTEMELGGKSVDRTKNPDYLREATEYREKLALRRVAIALAGGGMDELKGKTIDKQVELIADIDSGYLNTISVWLQKAALQKSAATFLSVSENSNGDLRQTALDA